MPVSTLYCAFQGAGNSGVLFTATSADGSQWTAPQSVLNEAVLTNSPCLVPFDDVLCCLHQGASTDGWLGMLTYDRTSWQTIPVADVGISGSPGGAVLGKSLYVFHQGRGDDGKLWCTTSSVIGQWTKDAPLNVPMALSPTVVVWNDALHVFFQGSGANGALMQFVNGSGDSNAVPGALMSESPAAVVYEKLLYVFYQGAGRSGDLQYATFDGANWVVNQTISGSGMSSSPGACVFGDKLYVLYQGLKNDGTLLYNVYDAATKHWAGEAAVSKDAVLSVSPAAAMF